MIEIVNNSKPIEIVKPTAESTQAAYNKGFSAGEQVGYNKGLQDGAIELPKAEGVNF